MAWRIVRQPNGLLARFSEVCDGFTDIHLTRPQALALCRKSMPHAEAVYKVECGERGGKSRYRKCIKTIAFRHGKESAAAMHRALSEKREKGAKRCAS